MTDFRLLQNLYVYSGGTVRELHTIIYSLVMLLPHSQALKLKFMSEYHYFNHLSINMNQFLPQFPGQLIPDNVHPSIALFPHHLS